MPALVAAAFAGLILFVRSLLVGSPGLAQVDLFVMLGAGVLAGVVGVGGQVWIQQITRRSARGVSEARDATGARQTGMVRFDRFSDRARRALTLAQEEAQRFDHNYIGTEHILLGLIAEGEGLGAKVLEKMHVDLSKVRTAVEFIIGRGPKAAGEVGLTPRAKRVIELAIEEARLLSHVDIGTGHLLLGLVREGEGIAAGVLQSLGVDLDSARRMVIDEMRRGASHE